MTWLGHHNHRGIQLLQSGLFFNDKLKWLTTCIPVTIVICMPTESKRWSNIALAQPAWSSFDLSTYPASQAVDNDVTTSSQACPDVLPFLALDLGSNVPVGFVSLRFAQSRCHIQDTYIYHDLMEQQQSLNRTYHHWLTHWGRVTLICVGNLTIIGSDNGLSPGRRQAIIWINARILLIGPLGTNFTEIAFAIQTFLVKKNAFENVVWKMAAILSRPQFVKAMTLHFPGVKLLPILVLTCCQWDPLR